MPMAFRYTRSADLLGPINCHNTIIAYNVILVWMHMLVQPLARRRQTASYDSLGGMVPLEVTTIRNGVPPSRMPFARVPHFL